MSSKYVLNKDGTIQTNEGPKSAAEVSQSILQKQQDSFTKRSYENGGVKYPALATLPAGVFGTGVFGQSDVLSGLPTDITALETPLLNEAIDPSTGESLGKVVSFPLRAEEEYFLINPSFGADEPIKYYYNYNNAYAEALGGKSFNKNIYAEELEMIAGFELNSLGLIASTKGFDASLYIFTFQYILEVIVYAIVFYAVSKLYKEEDEKEYNVFFNYFSNLLPAGRTSIDLLKSDNISHFFAYYILGLNEFINTDAKLRNQLIFHEKLDEIIYAPGNLGFGTALVYFFTDLFLGVSKVGRNRFFLTVRKFQQESYWNTELLYKSKRSDKFGFEGITAENMLDRFFIQFNQYFFLFMLQRVHVGYTVYKSKDAIKRHSVNTKNTRQHDFSRLNSSKAKSDRKYRKGLSHITEKVIKSDKDNYNWDGVKTITENVDPISSRTATSSVLSLLSLPNLLKTTEFFKEKGMEDISDEIKQYFSHSAGENKRISQDLVKKIEYALESEYVPFYFHDLRTNEIISFHAFLDSISDSFSPEYTSTHGYGRIDDVKHYVKTTRNISLAFNIISYNQEDFKFMWYQINKLVSMVYPQWSKGLSSTAKNAAGEPIMPKDFTFPFTQMPTASPMIRLRVGDVIKSNYSQKSLARLHGQKEILKDKTTPAKYKKVTKNTTIWQKTMQNAIDKHSTFKATALQVADKKQQGNNFLILHKIMNNYANINLSGGKSNKIYKNFEESGASPAKQNRAWQESFATLASLIGSVDKFKLAKDSNEFMTFVQNNSEGKAFASPANYARFLNSFFVAKKGAYFWILPEHYLEVKPSTEDVLIAKAKTERTVDYLFDNKIVDAEDKEGKINNAITKAFESSKGKGLAGFITSLGVDYQNSTWSTSGDGYNEENSIAPYSVKINIGFSPVHDIPPGLDHEGVMRAPIYNVGDINNKIFGDVYEKDSYTQEKLLGEESTDNTDGGNNGN